MSTKKCQLSLHRLADNMCGRYNIPLIVLHDFNKSGFSIFDALKEYTNRYTYANEIKVYDLALPLADVGGFQHEPHQD